ncbi:MAG TPA: Fic family protein [Candidatus Saccharimonadales bacterium]|nr:Fic family protein [Candidatus Saccharimonadales bacterium]
MNEYEGQNRTESDRPAEGPELTLTDIQLARQQCELQQASSPEQIQGMVDALGAAKQVAFSQEQLDAGVVRGLVRRLGGMVEPDQAADWRQIPATFASGDMGEHPEQIERAMAAWADAFADGRLDSTELYYHFEKIHPFADGNGRAGHCLWALAEKRQTGDWPQTLPPDVFAPGFEMRQKSAFGDIED